MKDPDAYQPSLGTLRPDEFLDSRGVRYRATAQATDIKFHPGTTKPRNSGITVTRLSAKPVELKRRARALKKASQ